MGEQARTTDRAQSNGSGRRTAEEPGARTGRVCVATARAGRALTAFAWLALGATAALGVSGCAVSEADVQRWEQTERGPYKLVAVVTHDKYPMPLRVDAALSLIKMGPRGGRRQGINFLCDRYKDEDSVERDGALLQVNDETRKAIVDGMAPEIIKQMSVPPPTKNADGTLPPDTSIPYKDAAFALVSHDPPLVTDEKTRVDLIAALSQWVQADFEDRIENGAQQYGVEQIMRFLGAPSVKALPTMLTESTTKLDRLAGLVADLGDPAGKQKASEALVALAKRIDSQDWITKQKPIVADADKRAGQNVNAAQLDAQLKQYQDQEITKVFGAMKRVGGRPVIEYAIAYGANANNSEDRRKGALAALEGRIEKGNNADIERLFNIAKDDGTPDSVRDLAFARIGELPKELMVPKLYQLFEGHKWKVRWVAATLAMKTMTTRDVPEFMRHLPANAGTKMGMSEPFAYGGILAKMEAPSGQPAPRELVKQYLDAKELGPKLTALGSFYGGSKKDVGVVTAHEGDPMPTPKCDPADECGWSCDTPKSPGSAESESHAIGTVGEFVRYCLVPSMTSP